MIRGFALALVVANLLLAAWLYTRPTGPAAPGAPPLAASPLVLVAELPDTPPPIFEAPLETLPGAEPEAVVTVDTNASCQALGPFADREAALAAAARLTGLGLPARPRAVDASERLGFWVHTPPAPNREAAAAVVEQLRLAGVRDFYVVVDGDTRNAVSLGVFRQRDGAEQQAGRLRAMGFQVEIGERRRESTVWWLDFPAPAGGSPAAAAVVELALNEDAPLLLQPRPCD
ncbi:MAG: SPOR domain-containing protein [Gammaproteobacteria bacterium]